MNHKRGGDKSEQEMYKSRAEYYKEGADRAIQTVSEIIAYKADTADQMNGHVLGRDSPLILIDIGASRSVWATIG